LSSFDTLLHSEKLVHVLFVLFSILVQLNSQVFYLVHNENASTLRARLGLADIQHCWILLGLSLRNTSILYFLLSLFILLLGILLNVMEFSRVHPGHWEELEVIWELFLKPLKVHSESTFTANIVHAQKVVRSLPMAQTAQELR